MKIEIDDDALIGELLPATIGGATKAMLAQREKGLVKYGTSLEESDLKPTDLIQHAIEEAADLSVYLQQLKEAYARELEESIRNVERLERRRIAKRLLELISGPALPYNIRCLAMELQQ